MCIRKNLNFISGYSKSCIYCISVDFSVSTYKDKWYNQTKTVAKFE